MTLSGLTLVAGQLPAYRVLMVWVLVDTFPYNRYGRERLERELFAPRPHDEEIITPCA